MEKRLFGLRSRCIPVHIGRNGIVFVDGVNAEDEKESYVSNVYIYIFFFLSKEKGQYILLKGFDYNKKCFDGK